MRVLLSVQAKLVQTSDGTLDVQAVSDGMVNVTHIEALVGGLRHIMHKQLEEALKNVQVVVAPPGAQNAIPGLRNTLADKR